MKVCTIDIETTDLSAVGAGWVLCAVLKPLDKKPIIFRYDIYHNKLGNEDTMIRQLFSEMEKYNLWVGHNFVGFDYPFLRSRAVQLELPQIRPSLAFDTMLAFKSTKYRTMLNFKGKPTLALDHITDFFGIPQKKTKIYPREHWKGVWHKNVKQRTLALDNLVDHCVADVEMTEQVYWHLIDKDKAYFITKLQ